MRTLGIFIKDQAEGKLDGKRVREFATKNIVSDDFWQAILILLQKDFDSTLNEALIFWDLDEYIWFNLKRIDFESSTGEIFFRDFQRRLVETGDSHFSDPLTYFKVLLFA